MKRFIAFLLALVLLPAALWSGPGTTLKLFPDADADKDGRLLISDALKFIADHPELQGAVDFFSRVVQDRVTSKPAANPLGKGLRVFVCANSFMIFTAPMLPAMADAAGIEYQDAGRQMIGGSRVIQHWRVPDDQNAAKTALREGRVDVLTLSPHALLPDPGIDNFTKLGLEKNPKLRVLVQASWPARDGELDLSFSNEKRNAATVGSLRKMRDLFRATWLKSLEKQVTALNDANGRAMVAIVPVFEAVFALRERVAEGTAPGITKQADLFHDAFGHPKAPLAALVAYCHFAAIHGRSPEGLPVPPELKSNPESEKLNALLQELAWKAVKNYPMSGVTTRAP